jgi:CHAT domain-containing protein
MQLSIPIPFIDDALGHSVIYEEYKGNYNQAQRIAEEKLNDARQQGDPALLADALLAWGVVHLLQGEPPAAIRCFQELEQTVPDDCDRRLRAASYTNLATFWHYNLFPDGNGAGATELEMRWNGEEYLKAEIPRRQAIFAQASQTSARFESQLVKDFLSNLQPSRAFLQTNRRSSSGMLAQQLLQTAVQSPIDFRETAEMYGASPSLLAYADLAAADLCHRAGNVPLGTEFLRRALDTYQQSGDVAGMAACNMLWGDWLAAPFSTPRVWNMAIQESNSSGSDLAWTLEAVEFGLEGSDLLQADAAYTEAEKLFGQANVPRGLANVQLRRGYLAMLNRDYTTAVAHATQAQTGFRDCGDRLGYWLAQTHRVLSRICAGQYPEERAVAEAIGTWGTTEGSFSYTLGLGLFLGRVGRHWLIREGDYERALACYRLAAALYRALGATTNLAKSLVDQGAVYKVLGERTAALTLYEQALDEYVRDIGARPSVAEDVRPQVILLANDVYQLYQDGMDADGMQRSADRIQEQAAQLPGGGDGLGAVAQLLGSGFSGIETFALSNLARSVIEQAGVLVPLYKALESRDMGNQAEADQLFQEALSAARVADEAQRDLLEAQVFAHQRAYDQAIASFNKSLAQGGADAGFVGVLTSVMQAVGGEQGQREALLQRERTHNMAFTFMVRVKAYAEAKSHWEELVRLAGQNWWTRDERPWLPLSDCAAMYAGLEECETALGYYDRAIEALETRRHQLSRDELKTALASGSGAQHLYFQATRTALTLAELAERASDRERFDEYAGRAFDYAERGKARALLDLMAGSAILAGSSKAESKTMRAWRQCNAQLTLWRGLSAQEQGKDNTDENRIAHLDQRIEAQETELRRIEAELAQSDPHFYETFNVQAQIMSLEKVQDALPPDTALLQYIFLGDDLLAWAITDQGMVCPHRTTVDAKALARQIRDFYRACVNQRNTEPLGGRLAREFLAPLAEVIQQYPHLIIVPYGAAHALPLHALPWRGEPLAATHTLSYLPSASTLQFVRSRDPGKLPDRILAVGDPKDMAYRPPLGGDARSLHQLPAAAVEAAYVASLFAEGKALIGDQATEEAVREQIAMYPLLLFATHGYLSEEAPLLSAILLADGEALNVYELMGLELRADLVVLSACRTALGEITGGDDVIGLTRGLLGAGARAAVVSLWPVNDVSTSLFMGEFYRQLQEGKTPAAALQAAQDYLRKLSPSAIVAELDQLKEKLEEREVVATALDVVDANRAMRDVELEGGVTPDDYSHPHYWAPFILMG